MSTFLRRFRRLNHAWANVAGYFWKPCPICGDFFGGHEIGEATIRIPAASEYLPGLRQEGDDVDVTEFVRDRLLIACWKHGIEESSDWDPAHGGLRVPVRATPQMATAPVASQEGV